ncbi:MAG: ribulose-phosphate 3-epimerase [Erysipelotrichaceae bacterium]|nr:ribulose-phosphate 3-epimerase [Erysipelotrichaceae bacterium]MDY5252239.1 ribulose-phosphate 3-epimerase [Erysipelotrichaceae bacterium]
MIISPSVLSLDYSDTKEQLATLAQSKAQWLHFDVMDGHFVPNLSFGPDILKAFKKSCDLFMDVHIMVSDPMHYSEVFIKAGADLLTFHYEAIEQDNIKELIDKIHGLNAKAGISIKPNTPVEVLEPFLPYVDLVLIMSVEPGFGGQAFDERALAKIAALKAWKLERGYQYLIEVDGGINEQTALLCKKQGVEVLVAGSYIFKNDIIEAVASLC